MISGRGFATDYAERARCRFGVEANYVTVDAEVLDYSKMICRSPEEFALPEGADEMFSVPFGIAFGEEEFKPWTMSTHRYRFYKQPKIEYAMPEEVKIGKFSEIYVYAYDDALFFERKCPFITYLLLSILCLSNFFPFVLIALPSGKSGDVTGILCNFDDFGSSMGMYINETAVMCVTPHI